MTFHLKEARVVLGLGEAKLDEGLACRLVPLASGSAGIAVHVSNLCNHLAAVFRPSGRLASQPEGRP
eukprot:1799239-Pleurochrysis_carterae.AAC.1